MASEYVTIRRECIASENIYPLTFVALKAHQL